MREKENSGKKPVRRSTSDESETAKVYRPRTAKVSGSEPKKKAEPKEERTSEPREERASENRPTERKQLSVSKEKRSRDEQYEEKRPARRDSSRDKSERKGDNDGSSTYKPRTLKSKSTEKDTPKREKFADRENESVRERNFDREEEPKKSFYQEKYSKPERIVKPERERYSKPSNERFEKPKFDKRDKREKPAVERVKKSSKKFSTAPEIDNELVTDKNGLIRLNKYIANSGLCSRREADEYITKGQITVNGVEVRELGVKVKLTDEVRFKDKALDPEKKVYILLNKPKDYVTTVEDPNATRTVMDLIQGACEQRVYPVGRLDRNSTGLLLFTNDGELTKQLTHPSFLKKKIYEVGLERNVKPEDMDAIRNGIDLDGEKVAADAIEYVDDNDKSIIGIEIHSGQNRVVRRIFEQLNYRVQKLDRVYFAGLTKKNLPRGKWRFLTVKEVAMLKMTRFK